MLHKTLRQANRKTARAIPETTEQPYQGPPHTQLTRIQDNPTHTQSYPPPKKEPYPATTGHTITKRQDRNKTVQQHRPTTEGGPKERRNPETIIYIQTNMF